MAHWSPRGSGKVVVLGTAGLWRWKLHRGETQDAFESFWTQLLLWLEGESDFAPGTNVAFHAGKGRYDPGEVIDLWIRTRDLDHFSGSVTILGPKRSQWGPFQPVAVPDRPATYTVHFPPPGIEGEYRAQLQSTAGAEPPEMETPFTVYRTSTEELLVAVDEANLNRLAQASGGQVLETQNIEALRLELENELRMRPGPRRRREIWDRWELFTALLGAFLLEWWLRKRRGMA